MSPFEAPALTSSLRKATNKIEKDWDVRAHHDGTNIMRSWDITLTVRIRRVQLTRKGLDSSTLIRTRRCHSFRAEANLGYGTSSSFEELAVCR